jgi:hypothetical protein
MFLGIEKFVITFLLRFLAPIIWKFHSHPGNLFRTARQKIVCRVIQYVSMGSELKTLSDQHSVSLRPSLRLKIQHALSHLALLQYRNLILEHTADLPSNCLRPTKPDEKNQRQEVPIKKLCRNRGTYKCFFRWGNARYYKWSCNWGILDPVWDPDLREKRSSDLAN